MTAHRPVSEIMSRKLLVAEEFENLHDVAADMERGQCRHLPVVDGVVGQGGKLVGLLSHRDLLRFSTSTLDKYRGRAAKDARLKAETFVGTVMTRDVKTVRPDTPVSEALQMLLAARFGCLPVVDEGDVLLGIVSEVDLLRLLAGFLNLDERAFDSAREFHRSPALNCDE